MSAVGEMHLIVNHQRADSRFWRNNKTVDEMIDEMLEIGNGWKAQGMALVDW